METWIPVISTILSSLCAAVFGFIGVGIGALISYLNNRQTIQSQAMQRREEREEQRRKEKIQINERDVLNIRDSVTAQIKMLSEYKVLELRKILLYKHHEKNSITDEEFYTQSNLLKKEFDTLTTEIITTREITTTLALSLELDTIIPYKNFADNAREFLELSIAEEKQKDNELLNKKWQSVMHGAAMLQNLLREKLISIRDTD